MQKTGIFVFYEHNELYTVFMIKARRNRIKHIARSIELPYHFILVINSSTPADQVFDHVQVTFRGGLLQGRVSSLKERREQKN